jgi:V8-like Glu-specific endopeptidase
MMDRAALGDTARDWVGDLTDAAASFDWPSVTEMISDYVEYLRSTAVPATAEIKAVLQLLRDNLRSAESRAVADAALALNLNDAPARRQYAQALVDGDNPSAALLIYRGIRDDSTAPPTERVEAHGGVGRCYKQLFVTTGEPSRRAIYLQRSLDAYLGAYLEDRSRYWLGINAAALLARGEREGLASLDAPAGGSRRLAEDVLRTVDELVGTDAWAKATAAEALIALGRHNEAIQRTKTFLRAGDVDAFKIAALLRQVLEIWEFDTTRPPGDLILPLLRSALLEYRGGEVLVQTRDVRAERVAPPSASDRQLEKVLGTVRYRSLTWYRTGLQRCRAVAQIVDANDDAVGTAFLVSGPILHAALPATVLMTNGHVIGDALHPSDAVHPADARVIFRGLDADNTRQEFRIVRQWWYEAPNDRGLDTTLVELDAYPQNVDPLPLARRLPALNTGAPRAYVIGHPERLTQPQFSLHDSALLDYDDTWIHYRSPTEGGSSGSPVFDAQWDLIGLHHVGSFYMPRLHGRGTYAANEAISLDAIRARLQERPPAPEEVE